MALLYLLLFDRVNVSLIISGWRDVQAKLSTDKGVVWWSYPTLSLVLLIVGGCLKITKKNKITFSKTKTDLTLLHSEWPKLYGVFGHSECSRVKIPCEVADGI